MVHFSLKSYQVVILPSLTKKTIQKQVKQIIIFSNMKEVKTIAKAANFTAADFGKMSEIKDYGSPEQKKAFEQFQQFIQLSSLYEQMSQTSPQNSAASPRESPTGAPVNPSPDSDLGSQIRNSLPPEKQALFDSYRSLFHNT